MGERAQEDTDYVELIRKITTGTNFDKLPAEHAHKCYAEKWKDLRIVSTVGGDLVYLDNLLVPPVS